tara:strand:+ start:870 stop:1061 length:192 start_codon:yes stop_codon:yes gene_type:complete
MLSLPLSKPLLILPEQITRDLDKSGVALVSDNFLVQKDIGLNLLKEKVSIIIHTYSITHEKDI